MYWINDSLEWTSLETPHLAGTINGYQMFIDSVKCSDSYLGAVGVLTNYAFYLAGSTGAVYEYSLNYKGDAGLPITCTWVGANRDFADQGASPDTFKTVYSAELIYLDLDASTQVDVYISTNDGTTWTTSPTGTKTLGTGSKEVKSATWHFPGGKTGQFFKPKIVSTSTTARPQLLGLKLDYVERGQYFKI